MTSSSALDADALVSLRRAVIAGNAFNLSTNADDTAPEESQPDFAHATHIHFNDGNRRVSFPLDVPTRFISSEKSVQLRSVLFAWQNKDVAIPDYIAAVQRLNTDLAVPGAAGGSVQNLVFIEKLDLVTWLEGATDESEHIKPLEGENLAAQASAADSLATGASRGDDGKKAADATTIKGVKVVDPRLAEIYSSERTLGDRNTVLRGIKPTDFSHVRKHAEVFLGRSRTRPGGPTTAPSAALTSSMALVSNLKKPSRRIEPIILLSPSASSLFRMSNIKSFLESGIFTPADSNTAGSAANMLQIQRLLPSIDPSRPMRFILVDTPEQFKPDYWSRVVAVFTTGQTWQFKSYKWTQPADLFSHALGIYVGWRSEEIPSTVRGWGRSVLSVAVDKWSPHQGTSSRWRDREVVERVWTSIEESMRSKGWGKDGLAVGR